MSLSCRRAALHKWTAKFGFNATYRRLLKLLIESNELNSANALIKCLEAKGKPVNLHHNVSYRLSASYVSVCTAGFPENLMDI